LEDFHTFNSSRAESGRMTGLNDSECGQIGVNSIHGTFGWTWTAKTTMITVNKFAIRKYTWGKNS
jgi:hypothetical protein